MNKPVAWIREDGVIAFHEQKEMDSQGYKWQPLYTHPADLTDEEIQQVLNDFDWFVKFVNPFEFAKAILRKAQEK